MARRRCVVNPARAERLDLPRDGGRAATAVTLLACAGPHASATASYWYGDALYVLDEREDGYETAQDEYTGIGPTAWATVDAAGGLDPDLLVLNVDTAQFLRPASMLRGDATVRAVAALILHRAGERPQWHGHRLHLVRPDDPLVPAGAEDRSQAALAMLARTCPHTLDRWAAAAAHDPRHLRDLGLAAVSTGSPELTAALAAHLGRAWPKAFAAAWGV